MTENKRFVSYFDKDNNYIIQDLTEEDEYQVGFAHCDEDILLETINEIAYDNEILQKENKELKSDRDYWKTLAQSLAKKNGKGDYE